MNNTIGRATNTFKRLANYADNSRYKYCLLRTYLSDGRVLRLRKQRHPEKGKKQT
jgi:hypothetical protein